MVKVERAIVPLSRYLFRVTAADQIVDNQAFAGVGRPLENQAVDLDVSLAFYDFVPSKELYEIYFVDREQKLNPNDDFEEVVIAVLNREII
jgi:hypothetical protein